MVRGDRMQLQAADKMWVHSTNLIDFAADRRRGDMRNDVVINSAGQVNFPFFFLNSQSSLFIKKADFRACFQNGNVLADLKLALCTVFYAVLNDLICDSASINLPLIVASSS